MDTNDDLIQLLTEWNLQHLHSTFQGKHFILYSNINYNYFFIIFVLTAQNIDFEVLKMLRPHHISKLFLDLTTGEQARFEYHLENWKSHFNTNEFSPVSNNSSTPQNKSTKAPTVMEILSNTSTGKDILKFYDNNKSLYEEQRNLLISTITKYIESQGVHYRIARKLKNKYVISSQQRN